jgi:hypothetical protein
MSARSATMNLPSTGNSGEKTQKRPRLYILATATLLLSAISFIGVGAIPQPQQAFAQLEDEEGEEECPPGTRPDVDEGTCVPIPDGEEEDEEGMNNNGNEQQRQ